MKKIKEFLRKVWGKIDPFWILLIVIFIFFIVIAKLQRAREEDYGYNRQNESVIYVLLNSTFYFIPYCFKKKMRDLFFYDLVSTG